MNISRTARRSIGKELLFFAQRTAALLLDKSRWRHLGKTLRYSLYVAIHPIDGFWDLVHEKRGSMGAAHVIVAATVLVEIMRITLTSFQFVTVNMEQFNAAIVVMRVVIPLLLWTVANWGLTTLMDGKGKMSHVYMGVSYAMVPYALINAAMIILSRFITYEEGAVYWILAGLAVLWMAVLIFAGMMMIHDYTPLKTLFSSFLTLVGMGIMVFVFVVFFSLVSDAVAYLVSVYREVLFRLL